VVLDLLNLVILFSGFLQIFWIIREKFIPEIWHHKKRIFLRLPLNENFMSTYVRFKNRAGAPAEG